MTADSGSHTSAVADAEFNKAYYFSLIDGNGAGFEIFVEENVAGGRDLSSYCTVKMFDKNKQEIQLTDEGSYFTTESGYCTNIGDTYYVSVTFSEADGFSEIPDFKVEAAEL